MVTREDFITSAADLRFRVGFSVIPLIAGTKKPIVSWEKYQKERAGYGEILYGGLQKIHVMIKG